MMQEEREDMQEKGAAIFVWRRGIANDFHALIYYR
jgi:hypothetical protein